MARAPRRNGLKRSISDETGTAVQDYRHKQQTAARPEAGAAPRFRAKKESTTYLYDSSLSPALEWDMAPARETASWLLAAIEDVAALPDQTFPAPRELRGADGNLLLRVTGLQDALAALKRIQAPFLNWTGKAERLSFEVPTLPLFVHERLSTEVIVKTLEGHRKRADQADMFSLFTDPQLPMSAQVNAYAYPSGWVNRMILGDSLMVMNSLAKYESLAGQVQCIYMDPPYGVKFGSNFQPFVRKRDVKNNDDEDMTREPEMVQAYRDTWSLGLHSYLTYLRDRLMVARNLLGPRGSIFIQISDENLHHVRAVMDEVFQAKNFVGVIPFVTTSSQTSSAIGSIADYLLWYCSDISRLKYNQLFVAKEARAAGGWAFNFLELPDGSRRPLSREERIGVASPPLGARVFQLDNLVSQGPTPSGTVPFEFEGRSYHPGARNHWKTTVEGMQTLASRRRICRVRKSDSVCPFFQRFSGTASYKRLDGYDTSGLRRCKALRRADSKQGCGALYSYDDGCGRPCARSHMRFRYNRLCC